MTEENHYLQRKDRSTLNKEDVLESSTRRPVNVDPED